MKSPCSALPFIEILEARIAPATFSVPALNGVDGFRIGEVVVNDQTGFSVRGAGDVNNDGFDDVIIGAPSADPVAINSGAAYVVFGKAGGFPANFDLTTLDGTNGFKIAGLAVGDTLGFSVSGLGDVNSDNFDDVIVGAIGSNSGGVDSGAAYVFFGKASGFSPTVSPAGLNGTNGFQIFGAAAGDGAGYDVGAAGDVNKDGFDDIIIGAPDASPNGQSSGAAYVVFGKGTPFTTVALGALAGTDGFKMSGIAANDLAGYRVASAGDINGDGFDEVIVGALGASPNGTVTGAAYVVFGKGTAFAANLDLSALTAAMGFTISGVAEDDSAGVSVSSAGDINGDGLDDLIVGASSSDTHGSNSGAGYLIFGSNVAFPVKLDLATLDGTNGFKISGPAAGNNVGYAASGAGDINGDGLDDLIIGAPFGLNPALNQNVGTAYIIFGKVDGYTANLELSSLRASAGFKIANAPKGGTFGFSVSAAGDINRDGFADVIVGSRAVGSYVFFGFDPNIVASANGKSLTLPDVDGDIVTIKVTKGRLVPQQVHRALDGSITLIDLTQLGATGGSGFAGFAGSEDAPVKTSGGGLTPGKTSNMVVLAKRPKNGSGDGLVDVGTINATGINLGKVKVSGSLGNLNVGAGVEGGQALKTLQVGAFNGGALVAGTIGTLKIKHNLKGVLNVTGGPPAPAGEVSQLTINKVVIGENIDGSAGGAMAGLLRVRGGIGSVVVKGDVIGGASLSGIVIGGAIGKIAIGGDLTSADPEKPVTISALGRLNPAKDSQAVAIKKLTVGAAVLNAQILAGYKRDLTPFNADASIGTITVQGNWSASSVVAGVTDSTHDGFGQNDTLIPGGSDTIVARIASLTIKGTATGSATGGDFFAITAEAIKKVKIGGSPSALTPDPNDLLLDATNNDFRLVEV